MLDPRQLPKFQVPLPIPGAMPPLSAERPNEYEIAVRQIRQQLLPPGYPQTPVWAYGAPADPTTFHTPAFTVEARAGEPVYVTWINQLLDREGGCLPHLLPIDQTIHWANPGGQPDSRGKARGPYHGPVPIVTHVHGAHVRHTSDGYPTSWFLPDANNLEGYARYGSDYTTVSDVPPGSALYHYHNDQRPTTLWYHDHTLGITRLNVYAGLAGFWLLRGESEEALSLPSGPYEIPLVIQDRSFNEDGSLFWPASRAFFDGFDGPYIPESRVHPTWNPEFFGNTLMANGAVWPYLEVEPRLYRFRLLNGCDSRFLLLRIVKGDPTASSPAQPALAFHRIGHDGGLIPDAPVVQDQMLLTPAERADVIIDFSTLHPGDELYLLNLAPDEPFGGEMPVEPGEMADPETTRQVLQFRVVAHSAGADEAEIPEQLPAVEPLPGADRVRDLTLHEAESEAYEIPIMALLGDNERRLKFSDPITERPHLGDTEVWRLINLSADSHPIHVHLVMFEVLGRQPFDVDGYEAAFAAGEAPDIEGYLQGSFEDRPDWEAGRKDTVNANPGEVTVIKAHFDLPGRYVWHCHILSHEDNEMMRPYEVVADKE